MTRETAAPEARAPGGTGYRAGFWLIALAFLAAMAFSTLPTPLYPLYQQRDGFSPFIITVIFAAYAVGVALSLVLVGHVSDWVGRRRVLIPALALEVLAAVVFLTWPQLPGLLLARFLSGFGIGMLTATATAHLRDLDEAGRPGAGSGRFEIVSVSVNIGGLGLGTLISGALAQFAPAPLATPFLVFAVVLLLVVIAVGLAPETVERHSRPYRPQRITVVGGRPARYLAAAGSAFVSFAVFGFFSALAPGFLVVTLHQPSRLLAGVVVFILFASAALAQSTIGGLPRWSLLTAGLGAEVGGLVLVAAGTEVSGIVPFLIGGALAGGGSGLLFKSAIGTIAALAPSSRRGEALASLFLIAYAGLIGPVLGIGVATLYVPAPTAMFWFAGILLVLLAAVAVLAVADGRAAHEHAGGTV